MNKTLTLFYLIGLGICIFILYLEPSKAQKPIARKNINWGLNHINIKNAWRITKGSKKVIVAIIDTGVDTTHPSLIENLWKNPGEFGIDIHGKNKATNGLDDDSNGYIDDTIGWNFVFNNNDLSDRDGHGTHIAGIIGAKADFNETPIGISPNISLMILKYYDPLGSSHTAINNTVDAINYAILMNAHIINYSSGGSSPSTEERAAINRAKDKGILFVAAAGNENSNSDINSYYPADYKLKNIISVGAIDQNNKLMEVSNYGLETVDIVAPGKNIYSSLLGGKFGVMTGTSQATAFVTGVAALIISHHQHPLKPEQIIKYLTRTGYENKNLIGKTKFRSQLNSYRALIIQDEGFSVTGATSQNTHYLNNLKNQYVVAESHEIAQWTLNSFSSSPPLRRLTQSLKKILLDNTLKKSPEA